MATKSFPIIGFEVEIGHKMRGDKHDGRLHPACDAVIKCYGESHDYLNLHFLSSGVSKITLTEESKPTTQTLNSSPDPKQVSSPLFLNEEPPKNDVNIHPSSTAPSWADIFVSSDLYVWFIDALRNEKCSAFLDDTNTFNTKIVFNSAAGWGHFDPKQ